MSQVEELLNSVAEVPVHTHPVPDTDTYFIIDPITRSIENTTRKKTVIMQYDHNSERFTFELPRFIDGHDMINCTSVTVNVDNIEAETGTTNSDAPDMTDLRIHPNDPEKVISSWLITRNSTQLAGHLSFHIEYKCADSNGNVVYEWATDSYDEIQVKARKKNGDAVVSEHADLLEQWRAQIFGAGDSVMANIAAEGDAQVAAVKAESETQQDAVELKGAQTLETIPEDYTAVDAMADEAVRSKGDAIVCEAEGEIITVKDSSDDYIRGLRVFGKSTQKSTTGKQLIVIDHTTKTNNGITFISNPDGSIHVKGTATANAYFIFDSGNPIPVTETELIASINGSNKVYMVVGYFTADETVVNSIATLDDNTTEKFVYPTAAVTTRTFIGVDAGTSVDATVYPMIRLATIEDDTYEPYTGGKPSPSPDYPQDIMSVENPKIYIHRKNLVRTDYSKTDTYEGMTVVITKGLSEVVLNGTTTKPYGYAISQGTYLVPGRYTMSVYGLNNVDKAYLMNMDTRLTVCDNVRTGSPVTFDVTSSGIYRIDFTFAKETTYANTTVKFQIEAGEMATKYESIVPFETVILNHTLPGIPVTTGGNYTDSDGQQWICDEVDLERGVYVKRIVEFVADDTLAYEKSTKTNPNGNVYFTLINKNRDVLLSNDYTSLCDNRTIRKELTDLELNDARIAVNSVGSHMCIWFCSDANTVEEMKSSMGDCESKFLLPIATPIETPLTAEEITAFKALRTNRPNTTILNDAGAWMTAKYNADTLIFLRDNQPKPTDDQVTTAVNAYLAANGVQVPSDKHISDIVDSEIGTLKADLVSSVIAALPVYNGEVVAE